MQSITLYGVGKFRDDIMTINSAEAAILLAQLYTALQDKDNDHANIAIPTIIDKINK